MFGPASLSFLVVAVVVTVTTMASTLLLWNRVRGPLAVRGAQRVVLVLGCQALAVAAVFAVVNRANGFYLHWDEILGSGQPATVAITPGDDTDPLPTGVFSATPSTPAPSVTQASVSAVDGLGPFTLEGGLYHATITGARSHLTGDVYVWTPPGYSATGPALPLLYALPGIPGKTPEPMDNLGLRQSLPQLIADQQFPGSIVVSATIGFDGKTWDCADVPGGPAVRTWLVDDVPAVLEAHFHLRTDHRWMALGISSGASCAVRLALSHPELFSTVISMAGDNQPESAVLRANPTLIKTNDLRTLAAAGTSRPVHLLLATSRQDSGTYTDATALQASVGPNVHADLETLSHGGHNWSVWSAMMPAALIWMGQHADP